MIRIVAACLAILPFVRAFSVTLPMAGSSLQEDSSFVVGWAFPPSTGSADIKLVTGAGEPYTTIATLKSGVSLLQVLSTVSIPNNITAGAYYIQIGDAPNDAVGGPYKVTTDPSLTTASSIMTASSSMSSTATSSAISSSIPLSSSATLSSSAPDTTQSASNSDTNISDASPTTLPLSNSNQSSANGSMIGGIVGGVAAIILIPGSILLWRRNKRKQRQQDMSDAIFWNQATSHDHDDGPSWGYPSSLKYSNASIAGGAAYDPVHRQDTTSPYSQAGYYDGYMPTATAAAAMHTPAPVMTRDTAMAGGAYYNGYQQHQVPHETDKFEENEKIHLSDELEGTQKPDQK